MVVLAVDVGGTKLAAALAGADGHLDRAAECPTPDSADPEVIWAALAGLVDRVRGDARPDAAGIGCGGPMRWPAGEVSPVNIRGWREFPLRARLAAYLGGVPTFIHNDAVAAALGEYNLGAGRGSRALLGVVVSTGVGGGLLLDGRVVPGPTGNAGHVGHLVVEPGGPACGCGGRGCLEAVARGPAIVRWAVSNGWTGEPTAAALGAAAVGGNPVARSAFTRAGTAVGTALAGAAALLDLDVVAVGGGVAQAGEVFFTPLLDAFHRHARLDFTRRCRVVPAGLGRQAGLVGAAFLALAPQAYASDAVAGTG